MKSLIIFNYSSVNVIRMNESRLSQARLVTTNEYRMLTENPSVTGMIVQKWILNNQDWKVQI
jgi:hypothetical protein